jgi:FolB domain-containing protein
MQYLSQIKMIIKLKKIAIQTFIGIHDFEKARKQDLFLNLTLHTNFADACYTDNINDTIDYDIIYEKIKDFTNNHHCELLEKFCYDLLKIIMQDIRIDKAILEVEKIRIFPSVKSCAITLSISR